MKIKDSSTAVDQFVEAAGKHAEATETGDYKTGNKQYNLIVKAVSFLKEDNTLNKLESLLIHPSVGVRLWSATYLLPLNEEEASKALKKIINGNDIHSFTAKTTLEEWGKGNLRL